MGDKDARLLYEILPGTRLRTVEEALNAGYTRENGHLEGLRFKMAGEIGVLMVSCREAGRKAASPVVREVQRAER